MLQTNEKKYRTQPYDIWGKAPATKGQPTDQRISDDVFGPVSMSFFMGLVNPTGMKPVSHLSIEGFWVGSSQVNKF